MLSRKIYNGLTWVWHRFLHVPIYLKATFDDRRKNPALTVVFLHGISATSDTWRSTIRNLERNHDFDQVRFIALDLLGFGQSLQADWLDYSYQEYHMALNRTLRKLKVTGPVVIIGHSMGSLIAADYVVNFHPVADIIHLILVSPPVLMAAELARLPDQVYTKSYASLHKIATDVPAAEVLAKLIQKFSSFRSDYIKTSAFAKSMENIILNRQNYQTYTKIRTPTLLLHGHFDPLVLGSNLRRAAKQNPKYLQYKSVIGQHDMSAGKRARIEQELKKVLQNESKTL